MSNHEITSIKLAYHYLEKTSTLCPVPVLKFPKLKVDSLKKKITSLEQIKRHVISLFNEKNHSLCTDLWFVTVLGLRKSELLSIKINASSPNIYFTGAKLL